MTKNSIPFESFLASVDEHQSFYMTMDDMLRESGYTRKIELKKSGYIVSYIANSDKKTLVNYVKRKKGILIRIYGDHADEYPEVFDTLTTSMKKTISKSGDCKRLIDPEACNSNCKMGVPILMDGKIYSKCRFSALFFLVSEDNYEGIEAIVKKELKCRQ